MIEVRCIHLKHLKKYGFQYNIYNMILSSLAVWHNRDRKNILLQARKFYVEIYVKLCIPFNIMCYIIL